MWLSGKIVEVEIRNKAADVAVGRVHRDGGAMWIWGRAGSCRLWEQQGCIGDRVSVSDAQGDAEGINKGDDCEAAEHVFHDGIRERRVPGELGCGLEAVGFSWKRTAEPRN